MKFLFLIVFGLSQIYSSAQLFVKDTCFDEMFNIDHFTRKVEKAIRASDCECLDKELTLLPEVFGEVQIGPDSSLIVLPVEQRGSVYSYGYLLKGNDVLATYMHMGNKGNGQVFCNCIRNGIQPYASLDRFIEFIVEKDLSCIYNLMGVSIGTYMATTASGERIFFEKNKQEGINQLTQDEVLADHLALIKFLNADINKGSRPANQ